MKALVIKNDELVPGGRVYSSARNAGFPIDLLRAYAEPLNAGIVDGYDALVVLGGKMSPFDDEGFPYLRDVMSVIERAAGRSIPVLGICLGAQLAARAFGAASYRGPNGREFGWTRMTFSEAGECDPLFEGVDSSTEFVEWHYDTFDLPDGATLLASSERYSSQSFVLGSVRGVQFHPEVDEAVIRVNLARDQGDWSHIDEFLAGIDQRVRAATRVLNNFWAIAAGA